MLVDSKQQKLGMQEIINIALEQTKSDMNEKKALLLIAKEVTLPDAIIVQKGNTIFVCHKTENPRLGLFRALNADTPQNYLQNSVEFTKEAYEGLGFDMLRTEFKDPTLLNIFKYIGRDQPADMGYKVEQSKNTGMYRVTVKIGKKRD
jgi:hypothetical protein